MAGEALRKGKVRGVSWLSPLVSRCRQYLCDRTSLLGIAPVVLRPPAHNRSAPAWAPPVAFCGPSTSRDARTPPLLEAGKQRQLLVHLARAFQGRGPWGAWAEGLVPCTYCSLSPRLPCTLGVAILAGRRRLSHS